MERAVGLVPVLGHRADLRSVVLRPLELRSQEGGSSSARSGALALSLVFCWLVPSSGGDGIPERIMAMKIDRVRVADEFQVDARDV